MFYFCLMFWLNLPIMPVVSILPLVHYSLICSCVSWGFGLTFFACGRRKKSPNCQLEKQFEAHKLLFGRYYVGDSLNHILSSRSNITKPIHCVGATMRQQLLRAIDGNGTLNNTKMITKRLFHIVSKPVNVEFLKMSCNILLHSSTIKVVSF